MSNQKTAWEMAKDLEFEYFTAGMDTVCDDVRSIRNAMDAELELLIKEFSSGEYFSRQIIIEAINRIMGGKE